MISITRTPVAMLGGAAMSLGLGFLMTGLIRVDFIPSDKSEIPSFEINPVLPDIAPPERTERELILKAVEVPPPPPETGWHESEKPSEPMDTLDTGIPIFDPFDLDMDLPVMTVADRNPQPILRVAGQMPPRAATSGHCRMTFSVGIDGQPFDVQASYCSDDVFRRSAIKATQKFKYNPKIRNGRPVAMQGVTTTMRYVLTDETGHVIPE